MSFALLAALNSHPSSATASNVFARSSSLNLGSCHTPWSAKGWGRSLNPRNCPTPSPSQHAPDHFLPETHMSCKQKTHPFLHTFACRFKFRGITSTPQPPHFERTFRCMSSRCCFSLMLLANFAPQEKQVNSTPPQQGSFSTEQVPQSGLGGTGRASNLAAAASITWRLVELSWKNSPHWGANSANSCCSSTRPPAKRAITRTSSGPSLPHRSVGCLLVQKWQTLCPRSDVCPSLNQPSGKEIT